MTVQITVIGLGQIGTSIGLSLASHSERVKRIGYDRVLEVQNKAKSLGAFDAVKFTLSSAIEGADVVVLCIPLDQVEPTLELIAPDLRQDAVILDFSPQKSIAHQLFVKHIPSGRHYIGLVPAINPQMLDQDTNGIDAASATLFQKATVGVAAPGGTSTEVLKLAADLVDLIGGQTIFLDMLEADGMEMTAHILPQVISAALLNATVGQPGWTETRRFAGRPFAQSTSALGADSLDALAQALLSNPLAASTVLNNAIGALTHIRTAVENGDKVDLSKRLELAAADRQTWLNDRYRAEWNAPKEKQESPKGGDILKHLFLGGREKKKK